jgi:hypothetical protein
LLDSRLPNSNTGGVRVDESVRLLVEIEVVVSQVFVESNAASLVSIGVGAVEEIETVSHGDGFLRLGK